MTSGSLSYPEKPNLFLYCKHVRKGWVHPSHLEAQSVLPQSLSNLRFCHSKRGFPPFFLYTIQYLTAMINTISQNCHTHTHIYTSAYTHAMLYTGTHWLLKGSTSCFTNKQQNSQATRKITRADNHWLRGGRPIFLFYNSISQQGSMGAKKVG